MDEKYEELVAQLRSEISLLSFMAKGCSCCPDYHRNRQEARAELAVELLDLLKEKHND